jgi:hypothetical protein
MNNFSNSVHPSLVKTFLFERYVTSFFFVLHQNQTYRMQSNPSKITNLIIDYDSVLLVNMMRSLSSVETLRIGHVCAPFREHWMLQNGSSSKE